MPSRGLNNQSSPEIVHGCPWVDDANTCNQYPTSPAGRLAVFLQCQTARHHCAQRSLDGLGGSRLLNKRKNTHIHIFISSIRLYSSSNYFHMHICTIKSNSNDI